MTSERSLDDRVRTAYLEAMKASHASACVAIHVGQQVWDDLKARVTEPATPLPITTMFGFPLVLEEGEPDHISIRTIRRIY